MIDPKVSIYIPTKNRSLLLKRAIESVLHQDYKNIEVIIIDDESSDDTQSVVENYLDKGDIKLIINQTSLGASASRNIAILSSNGQFVTGLDDDDYFSRPDRISRFVYEYNKSSNCKVALFDSISVKSPLGINTRYTSRKVTIADLKKYNKIGNQVFAERDTFIKSGLFDQEMPAWQDWDLWIRMAKNGYVFQNINLNSYVVDESHSYNRITDSDERKIRIAMDMLSSKIEPLTVYEKYCLTRSMLAYPGVRAKMMDLIVIFNALKISEIFKKLLKKNTNKSKNR